MHPRRPAIEASGSAMPRPMPGKENRRTGADSLTSAASSSSSLSTAPPKPLKPRQIAHPLAAADPLALSPRKRATAVVSSIAPPGPLPRRQAHINAASSAAASSAASHSSAAVSSASAAASSRSVTSLASGSRAWSTPAPVAPGVWTVRSAQLAAPVAAHWRFITRSRVVHLSLEQRIRDFQLRLAVRAWTQRSRKAKARWRARVAARTVSAHAFLRHAFMRLRAACSGPGRPSVERAVQQRLQQTAVVHFLHVRRSEALQRWRQVYARGVRLQRQADGVAVLRATYLARAALSSWRSRRIQLHLAADASMHVHRMHLRHLLRDAWSHWRCSQEHSALDRLASGVARKHAYKSTLRKAMRAWKRGVGAGIRRERAAVSLIHRRKILLLRQRWIVWRQNAHRLRVLGSALQNRLAALAAAAKRSTLQRWREAMLASRHSSRLFHIATRFRVRTLRLRALQSWSASVRLSRVRRLMGASSFELLRRKWGRWRAALASLRVERKLAKQADLHWQWQRLNSAVATWRTFVSSSQEAHLLQERATAHFFHHRGVQFVRYWARQASAERSGAMLRDQAAYFRRSHLLHAGLRGLRATVAAAHGDSKAHSSLRLFQRRRAVALWRRFSADRVAQYEHARLARRFKYLRALRVTFHAWLQQRVRERGVENRLAVRAAPLVQRLQRELFRHWSTLAAVSRAYHRKLRVAEQLDRSTQLQRCFALWRDRFQMLRDERQQQALATRHARLKLLARVLFGWDAYAYRQRHARRQVQEGVQWIRHRLDSLQRRRLFDLWRARWTTRTQHHQQREQAVLHHARCVLYRFYRVWQLQHQRRLAMHRSLDALTAKCNLHAQGRAWALWRHALGLRRRELHKHVISLRFWARRVLRRAWGGWAQFHALARMKENMLERALEHRRQKLRRIGLQQWLTAGMDMAETSLLVAQRDDASQAFSSVSQRRVALKYARLWRYFARRNAQRDAKLGGVIVDRLVDVLPFGRARAASRNNLFASYRPPPMQMRPEAQPNVPLWAQMKDSVIEEHKSPTSASQSDHMHPPRPATTLEAAAALFPRVAPSVRPPPRKPVDFDLPPLPLVVKFPLQATDPIAGVPMHSDSFPLAAAAPFSGPVPVYASPPRALSSSSSLSSLVSGLSVGGGGSGGLTPSPPPVTQADGALSLEHDVATLEEHLHRLLAWKKEVKQRRAELLQVEQSMREAAYPLPPPLLSRHHALQAAVAMDAEHKQYWQEQVRQVQQRLQQLMEAESM